MRRRASLRRALLPPLQLLNKLLRHLGLHPSRVVRRRRGEEGAQSYNSSWKYNHGFLGEAVSRGNKTSHAVHMDEFFGALNRPFLEAIVSPTLIEKKFHPAWSHARPLVRSSFPKFKYLSQ